MPLKHISGNIAQESGVSVWEIVSALYQKSRIDWAVARYLLLNFKWKLSMKIERKSNFLIKMSVLKIVIDCICEWWQEESIPWLKTYYYYFLTVWQWYLIIFKCNVIIDIIILISDTNKYLRLCINCSALSLLKRII